MSLVGLVRSAKFQKLNTYYDYLRKVSGNKILYGFRIFEKDGPSYLQA